MKAKIVLYFLLLFFVYIVVSVHLFTKNILEHAIDFHFKLKQAWGDYLWEWALGALHLAFFGSQRYNYPLYDLWLKVYSLTRYLPFMGADPEPNSINQLVVVIKGKVRDILIITWNALFEFLEKYGALACMQKVLEYEVYSVPVVYGVLLVLFLALIYSDVVLRALACTWHRLTHTHNHAGHCLNEGLMTERLHYCPCCMCTKLKALLDHETVEIERKARNWFRRPPTTLRATALSEARWRELNFQMGLPNKIRPGKLCYNSMVNLGTAQLLSSTIGLMNRRPYNHTQSLDRAMTSTRSQLYNISENQLNVVKGMTQRGLYDLEHLHVIEDIIHTGHEKEAANTMIEILITETKIDMRAIVSLVHDLFVSGLMPFLVYNIIKEVTDRKLGPLNIPATENHPATQEAVRRNEATEGGAGEMAPMAPHETPVARAMIPQQMDANDRDPTRPGVRNHTRRMVNTAHQTPEAVALPVDMGGHQPRAALRRHSPRELPVQERNFINDHPGVPFRQNTPRELPVAAVIERGTPSPRDRPGTPSPRERPGTPFPRERPGTASPREGPGMPSPRDRPGIPSPRERPGTASPREGPGMPSPRERPGTPFPRGHPAGGPLNLNDIPRAASCDAVAARMGMPQPEPEPVQPLRCQSNPQRMGIQFWVSGQRSPRRSDSAQSVYEADQLMNNMAYRAGAFERMARPAALNQAEEEGNDARGGRRNFATMVKPTNASVAREHYSRRKLRVMRQHAGSIYASSLRPSDILKDVRPNVWRN